MSASEETLHIRLLGELRVSRGEVVLPLPPSRKTRALLGYLLLTGREHRRERLCSLLWDVADDPRGALRWSLSKLRALVDTPSAPRLEAGREGVAIRLLGAEVDALSLRASVPATGGLERFDADTLEGWADRFSGELLEGLDLPDFDEFQAFCVAEREHMRRLHARVLGALTARLSEAPERALRHARRWAALEPTSLSARTQLLRVVCESGRQEEAAQHYAAARRLFAQERPQDLAALERAWEQLRRVRTLSVVPAAPVADPAQAQRPSRPPPSAVPSPKSSGRAGELAALRARLESALTKRRAGVVLLDGETGSGKSHLLRCLGEEAQALGARLVQTAARECEQSRPYAALLDSLQTLAGDDFLARIAPAQLAREGESAEQGRRTLLSAASELLTARARQERGLCLVVDDAHWLDEASVELLWFAARSAADAPLLIVLAVRSEERGDLPALGRMLRSLKREGALSEHKLSPLSDAALADLLSSAIAPDQIARIVAQAGGNPRFALELSRAVELGEDALPESVTDAVRERLSRVSAAALEVLRWGAVLDDSFGLDDLHGLSPLPDEELVSALEQLESNALVSIAPSADAKPATRYRFAHDIVRRVVYAGLSHSRRKLMHGRVARRLDALGDHRDEPLSKLVRHAALAEDHSLATEACVAAGARCLRLFAYKEAAIVAERGLRHARHLDGLEHVRRAIELLEIQLWCTPPGEATDLAERIRALGEEAHSHGAFAHAQRAHHVLSHWHFADSAMGVAQHHSMMAELISRSADEGERLVSLSEAGRCLLLLGREHERARAMLDQAESQARRRAAEPAVLRDGQGLWHLFQGELGPAARCFDQAAVLASVERNRLVEFHALEHRMWVEFERGDYEAAARLSAPLLSVAQGARPGSELPLAQAMAALARYATCDRAHADVEQWLEQLRDLHAHRYLMHALALTVELDVRHERSARALRHARELYEVAGRLERPSEISLALAVIVHTERRVGSGHAAESAAAELRARGEEATSVLTQRKVQSLLTHESEARSAGAL